MSEQKVNTRGNSLKPSVSDAETLQRILTQVADLSNGKTKLNWLHYFATLLPLLLILVTAAVTVGEKIGSLQTNIDALNRFATDGDGCTGRRCNQLDAQMHQFKVEFRKELSAVRREMRSIQGERR